MQTLRRTAAILIWPAIACLGSACDRLDPPTAGVQFSIIPPEEGGPGKVTGGGQIDVIVKDVAGTATFGFNAKRVDEEGSEPVVSGHLNYVNHVSGVHINCEVEAAAVTPAEDDLPGTAAFGGYACSPNSSSSNFIVHVVDTDEPGREDVFTIEYTTRDDDTHTPIIEGQGSPIRSGNIQVHKARKPVEGSDGQ